MAMHVEAAAPVPSSRVSVGRLEESELDSADHVLRLAFGTRLGLPDPSRFGEGAELVRLRWRAYPSSALKAEIDGELVACAFVARWGSVAIMGPLAVHPDHWNRGIGARLWETRIPLLDQWGVTHAGLFTGVESPKNVHLYQKFGFWPRFLTAITAKVLELPPDRVSDWTTYSALTPDERTACVGECRELTSAIYPGLDLEREMWLVREQGVGDVLLLRGDGVLQGFAICHLGAGSEAGPGALYVKFAAVRPGPGAGRVFERMLDCCETLAAAQGLSRLVAGVNLGRREAYRALLARGHRTFIQGVAMHRADEAGYDRPATYVIDDWR